MNSVIMAMSPNVSLGKPSGVVTNLPAGNGFSSSSVSSNFWKDDVIVEEKKPRHIFST